MTKRLLLSLFLLLLFRPLLGQEQAQIKGFVTDSKTGEPIPGVNVYLSGTTSGQQTNAEGAYSFSTKLKGSYTLVASYIGYEPQAEDIFIDTQSKIHQNFRLKLTGIELDEIVVTASNEAWFNRFKSFSQFFIGMGPFSEDVTILNGEVLDFGEPDKKGFITVTTKSPLMFTNSALGYEITTDFIEVVFNPNTYDGRYVVYTNFKEMTPPDVEQKNEWIRNRVQAYNGSPKHFFTSFLNGSLRGEGFRILPEGGELTELEDRSLVYQYFAGQGTRLLRTYHALTITEFQMAIGHDVKMERSGRIQNRERISYVSYGSADVPFFFVSDNGNLYDPKQLEYSGKWGLERASVLLPLDYNPTTSN